MSSKGKGASVPRLLAVWGACCVLGVAFLACSSSGAKSPEGTGGSGGTGSTTTTWSGATVPQPDGGICDDLGLDCGNDQDPGCQGCALAGGCKPQADACVGPEGAGTTECIALNDCYLSCPDGEEACFSACDAQHADGVLPLNELLLCLFCAECPASCNIDTSICPG